MARCSGRSTCSRGALVLALAAQLAVAHVLIAHGVARADDASTDAGRAQMAADLRARADAAMDGGSFADAVVSYRASYELLRNPALLYNIASAYERLGDYPRALSYLEQFSRAAPADLKARVPRLDDLIASVRAKLARVVVRCNVPGARVLVRGSWLGSTPTPAGLVTMPGPARVEVVADGYRPFVREVRLAAGRETRVDAMLVSSAAFDAPPPPPARRSAEHHAGAITSRWWFWTGLGVLAAAGGAAVAAVALGGRSRAPSGDAAPGRISAPLVTW
jgi:hypothetical protein